MRSLLTGLFVMSSAGLAACVGPKVPSYETDVQSFEWGTAYAWMSKERGTLPDATSGRGYILFDMRFRKDFLDRGCVVTAKFMSIVDPKNSVTLVEADSPTDKNGVALEKVIGEYRNQQLRFDNFPFNFEQTELPYNVRVDLALECPDYKARDMFSKPIKFKMVQPVMWEQ